MPREPLEEELADQAACHAVPQATSVTRSTPLEALAERIELGELDVARLLADAAAHACR